MKPLEQNAKGSKRKGQGVMAELGWHPRDGGEPCGVDTTARIKGETS